MNAKTKISLNRIIGILLTIVIFLGSLCLYPSLSANAANWSAVIGTSLTTPSSQPLHGYGSGSGKITYCHSVDAVCFSFWDASHNCVGAMIQTFNTTRSSNYSNHLFQNGLEGQIRPLTATDTSPRDGSHPIVDYLNGITNPSYTASHGVPIYITDYNALKSVMGFGFCQSVNTGKMMLNVSSDGLGRKFGLMQFGLDYSYAYQNSTPASRYIISYAQLSNSNMGALAALAAFNAVNGTSYVNGTDVWIGVSEIALHIEGFNIVYGCSFPEPYNVMGVMESTDGIFPLGQNACFTYDGAPASGISTYDINRNPDVPAKSEQPNDYAGTPQFAEKSGDWVINKIYYDLASGTEDIYTTTATTHMIIVDSEAGKLSDPNWQFQYLENEENKRIEK